MSGAPQQLMPEFDALAAHLTRISGRQRLVFCPSPGNWGDAIINAGTRRFLRRYNFSFEEVSRSHLVKHSELSDAHVLIGGGGGWCEFWHTTPELVEKIALRTRHMTVLPTTFGLVPNKPTLAGNVTLFARDTQYSLKQQPTARFCHDMAFFFAPPEELSQGAGKGHLNAFRKDRESTDPNSRRLESDMNFDISLEGTGFTDPYGLYERIGSYGSVATDRLHVGIASAQLGLEVKLYASAYPKVESVFASTMQGVYPNVSFVESREEC